MRIAIIGAGLGGLAAALGLRRTGHAVTVYEQAPTLGEVGAGIQVAPNASRILRAWGLEKELSEVAVMAQASRRRRWEDGRVLGESPLGDDVLQRYGAPYAHVHRADLHRMLLDACVDPHSPGEPVTLVLNSQVVGIQGATTDVATVLFAHGGSVDADVVVGADGIHSQVRSSMGVTETAQFSGDVAWRALVPVGSLEQSGEDFGWILDQPSMTVWLGPGKHVVHYLVRGGELVNLVALLPGSESSEDWLKPGDPEELRTAFADWAPKLRSLLAHVEHATKSGLYDRQPLHTWTHGRVALLGDACHAMLPYQAQGAAQAFEDAAALVEQLDGAASSDVPKQLRNYEEARRPRATRVQEASRANQHWFHMPDGPEQRARDHELGNLAGDAMVSFDWLWSGSREMGEQRA